MKKILLIFLLLIITFTSIFLLQGKNKDVVIDKSINEKLIEIGYTQNNIDLFNNKLTTDNINYLVTLNYDIEYINIISESEFNKDKLDSYIDFYNKYKSNAYDTVYLVNNSIDKYDIRLVSLLKEKYYKSSNLDRYYNFLTTYPNYSTSTIVSYINSNLDYDYYSTNYPTDTSKGYLMLANKFYTLSNFAPNNLVVIESNYGGNGQYIQDIVYNQYKKMFDDMKSNGLNLVIRSAYRSYQTQVILYNNYVARDGVNAADTYSARAGYSEHQTGLAMDLGTPSTSDLAEFESTDEFKWMQNNAYKYGFILRYPSDKTLITGYMYESWHYRYVGVEAATYIKENRITFDEYYEYFVK